MRALNDTTVDHVISLPAGAEGYIFTDDNFPEAAVVIDGRNVLWEGAGPDAIYVDVSGAARARRSSAPAAVSWRQPLAGRQRSAAQRTSHHSTAQHSTAQHSTAQHSSPPSPRGACRPSAASSARGLGPDRWPPPALPPRLLPGRPASSRTAS